MDAFTALAEPTRRRIVELLAAEGQLPASEIARQFPMSAPAISQHLKALREADLVCMEKQAQFRIYRVNPAAMLALEEWARQMRQTWNARLDALDSFLEAHQAGESSASQGPGVDGDQSQ